MNAFQNGLVIASTLFTVVFSAMGEPMPYKEQDLTPHSIDSSGISKTEVEDWHLLVEEMAENGLDAAQWEERLSELAINPVSLNEASQEMLESLPMLNADQVENLSYYLYRYGPIAHLSELMLVEGMTAETMRWLRPFVCIEARSETPLVVPPMKKAWQFGKQEIRCTMGATLQEKAGYDVLPNDSSDRYVGDPIHGSIRYGFDYKGQLQWGLVVEKDPGERWWNSHQSGVDYSSFHFLAKDPKSRNMCLFGDYNVRFGQGLVCGNAFSLGKNTSGIVPEQTGAALSRHFSSSESHFFRGVAVRIALLPFLLQGKKRFGMELCTFVSKRTLDASVQDGFYTSISETGLHRTETEMEMEKRLKQSVVGGHLGIRWIYMKCGLTALTWQTDASATGSNDLWNMFQNKGKLGGNISADWRMLYKDVLVFGEAALDQNGHHAFLTGTSFRPYPRMSISMLGRSYSPAYQAVFSNAFSEGTSTSNEQGFFTSMDMQLAKRLRLAGYVDVFRSPWLNYAVRTPSYGQDVAVEISSTIGRNGSIKLLIKNKVKEKQDSDTDYPTYPSRPGSKSSIRLQINQKQGIWSMKTVLFTNDFQYKNANTNGIAIAQDLGVETRDKRLSMLLHAVLFQTEEWENRIYLWEKDVPGAFSMPMLYGRGCRLAFFMKYEIRNLRIQFKLSDAVQPGMEALGDGLERISGNRKTEARLQLGWKF